MSIPYFETSAKTGEGIENLFQKFAEDMVRGWAKANTQQEEKVKLPPPKKCTLL
jgi:hypothetical protein